MFLGQYFVCYSLLYVEMFLRLWKGSALNLLGMRILYSLSVQEMFMFYYYVNAGENPVSLNLGVMNGKRIILFYFSDA